MKKLYVDTNVFLRFLLQDNIKQAKVAEKNFILANYIFNTIKKLYKKTLSNLDKVWFRVIYLLFKNNNTTPVTNNNAVEGSGTDETGSLPLIWNSYIWFAKT